MISIVWRIAGLVAALAVVVALPKLLPNFGLVQVTTVIIIAIALSGLNLVTGYLGEISLAHGAFFGIGAYTSAILVEQAEAPIFLALPAAAALSFLAGTVLGLPALRLNGLYLTLVTLAAAVAFPSIVKGFPELTGGASGIFGLSWRAPEWTGLRGWTGDSEWGYWVAVVVLVIVVLVVANLRRSRFGRAWIAVKDNPVSAASMGVNRAKLKTLTFGVSAGIAGLAGSLYPFTAGVLTPEQFTLILSIQLLIALIVGGSGSIIGPLIGGVVFVFLPYVTADIGGGPVSGVIFGGILIVLVFVMPKGIVGLVTRVRRALSRRHPEPSQHRTTAPSPRTTTIKEDVSS